MTESGTGDMILAVFLVGRRQGCTVGLIQIIRYRYPYDNSLC
jgi:hypothetical protein